MKAEINGFVVEGTPEEIQEFRDIEDAKKEKEGIYVGSFGLHVGTMSFHSPCNDCEFDCEEEEEEEPFNIIVHLNDGRVLLSHVENYESFQCELVEQANYAVKNEEIFVCVGDLVLDYRKIDYVESLR